MLPGFQTALVKAAKTANKKIELYTTEQTKLWPDLFTCNGIHI